MKTIIHVNQHVIKKNRKLGENNPPLTVKTYKTNVYCHEVAFTNGVVIYRPGQPLSCGAHLWIETQDEIKILKRG